MPEPIKQEVSVDYDGSGAREAAQSIGDVGRATEDAAKSSAKATATDQKHTAQVGRLKQRLETLVAAQINYEQQLQRGVQISEADTQLAQRRSRQINRVAGALTKQDVVQRRVNETMRGSAQSSREVGEATDGAAGSVDGLGASVEGAIGRFASFAAIGATIVQLFQDIEKSATGAVEATAKLGEAQRGLTANVGGVRAARLQGVVTAVAGDNKLNVEGRNELLEAVTALTDLNRNLDDDQIEAQAARLAQIKRTTGVGGRGATEAFVAARDNLGLTDDQAQDLTVSALNSGVTPQAFQELASRGRSVDALALLVGGREEGLNVNRAGEQVNTLIGSLTRRDAEGKLSDELTRAGVTEDQGLVDRFRTLVAARDEGKVSAGQFETAIGGAQNLNIVDPLSRSLSSGAFDRARASLTNSQATEQAIAELEANPLVRSAERQNLRDLVAQTERERPSIFGESQKQAEADFPDSKIGSFFSGITRGISSLGEDESDAEFDRLINQRRIRRNVGESLDEFGVDGGEDILPEGRLVPPTDDVLTPAASGGGTVNIAQVNVLGGLDGRTIQTGFRGRGL